MSVDDSSFSQVNPGSSTSPTPLLRVDMQMNNVFVGDLTRGHTGRQVRCDSRYLIATEWARLSTADETRAHRGCVEFVNSLASVPRLEDASMRFFRGLPSQAIKRKSEDMGPPPDHIYVAPGRYNWENQRVLYLCDSVDGVCRERSGDPRLDVQSFLLPPDRLLIADFTAMPVDHFVTQVFSKAEECEIEDFGARSYIFSEVVAELVSNSLMGCGFQVCVEPQAPNTAML